VPIGPSWSWKARSRPPGEVVKGVAEACGVSAERLTILYAPTRSLAGSVQVVARVVEVALQKARALKFPLDRIVDAIGSAPLSPPHPDLAVAMGRTNDAIIYGGRVQLFVSGGADAAAELAHGLPSFKSRDYGAPVRRDLPPLQRRFLRHRPDAVQPGPGDR
jgi:methenyltetrahydromethanopterin cyclohydrolase